MSPFWILLFQIAHQIAMGCLGYKHIPICSPSPLSIPYQLFGTIEFKWPRYHQKGPFPLTNECQSNFRKIYDENENENHSLIHYLRCKIPFCRLTSELAKNHQSMLDYSFTGTQSEQITSFWMKENPHTVAKFLHGSSLMKCSWRSGKFREQHAVAECESCC